MIFTLVELVSDRRNSPHFSWRRISVLQAMKRSELVWRSLSFDFNVADALFSSVSHFLQTKSESLQLHKIMLPLSISSSKHL